MQHEDEARGLEAGTEPVDDAGRLQSALEALEARDLVLEERHRRLAELEAAAGRAAALASRLEEAQTQLASLRAVREAELGERDRRIAALEQRLLAASREGPEATPPAASAAAPVPPRWRTGALPAHAGPEQARDQELMRRQGAALEALEARIRELDQRLDHLRRLLEAPDDLKLIRGVGPLIERALHSMGITTFTQVAALSAEDETRVGTLLGAFPDRIRRERWREQAADLDRARRAI